MIGPLTTIATDDGVELQVGEVDPSTHGALLHREFNGILAAGEGYPHAGPISYAEFSDYWLKDKSAVVGAWARHDGSFVGSYFLKPNGPGRAAHVGNAGYFVVPEWRGQGVGEALVVESMERARSLGFDALQFNFVFETNPARSLYERLGFRMVGRVPDVIDGEAVCIYWRPLT
jgi:GNAT superfamily N-acetyltransferase